MTFHTELVRFVATNKERNGLFWSSDRLKCISILFELKTIRKDNTNKFIFNAFLSCCQRNGDKSINMDDGEDSILEHNLIHFLFSNAAQTTMDTHTFGSR